MVHIFHFHLKERINPFLSPAVLVDSIWPCRVIKRLLLTSVLLQREETAYVCVCVQCIYLCVGMQVSVQMGQGKVSFPIFTWPGVVIAAGLSLTKKKTLPFSHYPSRSDRLLKSPAPSRFL